jgi:hypothetical protein
MTMLLTIDPGGLRPKVRTTLYRVCDWCNLRVVGPEVHHFEDQVGHGRICLPCQKVVVEKLAQDDRWREYAIVQFVKHASDLFSPAR